MGVACFYNYFIGDRLSFVRMPVDILDLIKILINGKVQGPYWYMPFILVVFVFAIFLVKVKSELLIKISFFSYCTADFFYLKRIMIFLSMKELFVLLLTSFIITVPFT